MTWDKISAHFPVDMSSFSDNCISLELSHKVCQINVIRDIVSRGTGIPKEGLYIQGLHCTIERKEEGCKYIVWVTASEETVRRAFKVAARTRLENFNIFPSIPEIAKLRKKVLQSLLNEFHVHE